MGERVASILAEIGIDSSKFTTGANGVKSGLSGMVGGFAKLAGGIGIAVTALGTLYEFLKKSEQAAVESAKIDAKLEAVLRSTGNAVGITSDQLDAYATSVSKLSGIDDEMVKNAEAVLLTFTRIGGEVFPQVVQAATDMSAVLGGDLQGSIIQVGKAFNDFTGYAALKRSGVSFTQEQIAQIKNFQKTNNLVGYQNLLLAELQKEFGGAAKAMNEAGDGAENLKVAWGNLQEAIGQRMVAGVGEYNNSLTKWVDSATYAINTANEWSDALSKVGIQQVTSGGYVKDGERLTYKEALAIVNASRATEVWGDRLTAQANAYKALHPEIYQSAEELQALADAQEALAQNAVSAGLAGAIEKSVSSYQDLIKEGEDLQQQQQDLIDKGWSPAGSKVKELNTQIDANTQAQIDAKEAIEATTEALMQQAMLEGLNAEQQLELGRAMGIVSEGDYQAVKQAQAINQAFLDGAVSAEQAASQIDLVAQAIAQLESKNIEINETTIQKTVMQLEFENWANSSDYSSLSNPMNYLNGGGNSTITIDADTAQATSALSGVQSKLDGLQDKTVTVTINTNFTGGGIGAAEKAFNYDLNGNGIIGAAHGLNMTVPPGYPNDSFLIRAQSGEHVNITPAGKQQAGGGNNVTLYGDAIFNTTADFTDTLLSQLRLT